MHHVTSLTWISALMAAFRADSNPPSAIKLLTSRSIIKRRPGLTLVSFPDAASTKRRRVKTPPRVSPVPPEMN